MDSKNLGGRAERAVGCSVYQAFAFFQTDTAQDVALLSPCFFRVFSSSSVASNFFFRFFTQFELPFPSVRAGMFFSHVFLRRNPFQVVGMVVGSVVILVMDVMGMQGFFKPAKSYHSMNEAATASAIEVSSLSLMRIKWNEISKNLAAPGDCIQRTVEPILDAFYRYAVLHKTSLVNYSQSIA